MKTLIFDMEADGLYEQATTIWCASTIRVGDNHVKNFTPYRDGIDTFLDYLSEHSVVVGHNIIEYDLRLLKKLHGYVYTGNIIDTLVLSRYLYPERAGGHSIEAWGKRLGRYKPEHEDWSKFTPEMMVRCEEDTGINLLVLDVLMEELQQRKQTVKGEQLWI